MGTVGKAAQAGLHNRALVVLVEWVRSHSQVEKQTVCKVCTFTPLRGVLCLGKGPLPRCIPARGFAPLPAYRLAFTPGYLTQGNGGCGWRGLNEIAMGWGRYRLGSR